MKAKSRILVVYYSLGGNTDRVAKDVARHFNADIECIVDMKRRKGFLGYISALLDTWRHKPATIRPTRHDPSRYSLVLLGTPVWGWNITPALRAYVAQTRRELHNIGLFITSGNTDVARIVPFLKALTNCDIVAAAGFNAQELADKNIYENKLKAFIHEVENPSTAEPTVHAMS